MARDIVTLFSVYKRKKSKSKNKLNKDYKDIYI